ncbi:ubiquitin protein ligase e3a [Vairimorpha ceranae]|uniref:HECT-type E3 ubiquitin transferase n=1 Tax=Vairimorpha ceranae TaxID=40302 RepID=A0A0F9WH91_9MICR|nr:ubiquitin protein ligase e3a [Vairimorpha ceranae]KKO76000.1 ubiquitin protein ligase e3a [Vairimorpha ceranae]
MIKKNLYAEQLSYGCKRQNCLKAFCRKIENPNLLDEISAILCDYDDIFLCENTNKLVNGDISLHKYKFKENQCINLLIHYLDLFKIDKNKSYEDNNVDDLILYSPYNSNFNDNMDLVKDKQPLKNITNTHLENGMYDLNISNNEEEKHFFCNYFNKNKWSSKEYYLISGVVHILIKKYKDCPFYTLGLLILRLYSIVSMYSCTDLQKLTVIFQISTDIFKSNTKKCNFKKVESEKDQTINNLINVTFDDQNGDAKQVFMKSENGFETQKGDGSFIEHSSTELYVNDCKQNLEVNKYYICFNEELFNKNDLFRLIVNMRKTLNRFSDTNIRENKRLELMLNIFYLMFEFNENLQVVQYKKFYLNQFCLRMNFKEEYKFFRTKGKSILSYSFILPVYLKAEVLKSENNDLMKTSLQDSFFRSLFEGHIEPYLFITVNRENIYSESLKILLKIRFEDMHKQLRITFKNEEGVDSGGIRKEYFQLLSHEIKHDDSLFIIAENIIWLKNDCLDFDKYYCIGKILGIALYNNVVLNIPFPSFFFKKLLNKKTTFNDLKEIDHSLYLSLSKLKKLSAKEIENLELTFTVIYTTTTGEVKSYNLDKRNREIKVTKANLHSFINKYSDFILNKLIKKQFNAIKEGFYFVINKNILTPVNSKELEKIILGSNNLNVDEIKSTTSYSGYKNDSTIIKYFWEIFESYSKKMKKKLIQFITGHDRIPIAGAGSLKLVIMKNGCDTERLPSSQTCFNTLLLPEYSSKEKLEGKLRTALEMTAGFFLL